MLSILLPIYVQLIFVPRSVQQQFDSGHVLLFWNTYRVFLQDTHSLSFSPIFAAAKYVNLSVTQQLLLIHNYKNVDNRVKKSSNLPPQIMLSCFLSSKSCENGQKSAKIYTVVKWTVFGKVTHCTPDSSVRPHGSSQDYHDDLLLMDDSSMMECKDLVLK
jgi:hypothetical protein